jgi:hypothetical protein
VAILQAGRLLENQGYGSIVAGYGDRFSERLCPIRRRRDASTVVFRIRERRIGHFMVPATDVSCFPEIEILFSDVWERSYGRREGAPDPQCSWAGDSLTKEQLQ